MTIEEQLSWAVDSDSQTARELAANTRQLMALQSAIYRLNVSQDEIKRTLDKSGTVSAPTPDLIGQSSFVKDDEYRHPVSTMLDPEVVLMIHRLTCYDFPSRTVGRLRSQSVLISNSKLQPPAADDVAQLLVQLCDKWTKSYKDLKTKPQKLSAIAEFHRNFLAIHPFADGNGRVARAILAQQCIDLFGKADMTLLNKGGDYYEALVAADNGDYTKLANVISPVVAD